MARPSRIRPPVNDGVLVGAGSVATELAGLARSYGGTRVAVMTTPSVSSTPLLATVVDALGELHVTTFAGSRAHTPRGAVLEAAESAAGAGANCLVSLGGSSVVDLTKGVAMVLAEGRTFPERGFQDHDFQDRDFDRLTVESGNRLAAPKLPHLAIPTTLSAAEFTMAAGITDTASGVKQIFASPTLAARWVLLDAEMTVATPARLWAGTGMKLIADCLEGLLSPFVTRYTMALLEGALAILLADLGAPVDDLAARGRCLEAAHMTLSNLHNAGIGAVAALRHQIGGRCGVPHGEASTIVLPHVMRWNGEAARPVLDRLGGNGSDLVRRIESLIGELGLPRRLRDVGVTVDDLDPIATNAAQEASARRNVRPADAAGLRDILDAAY